MPKAEAPELIEDELILDVRKEGDRIAVRVDGRECTLEELPVLLKPMAQQNPDRCVCIRAAADVPHERMKKLVCICLEAGFSNLFFSANFNLQEQ
ncbi:MAG: ExbD/TolR family protein [Akkermansia sp.]